MQDIRKPYNRLKSNRALDARVEAFEKREYEKEEPRAEERRVPRAPRHGSSDIVLYPRREEYPPLQRKRRSTEMWLFAFVVSLIIAFVGLYTYVFDSATITFTPKYSDVGVNKAILLSTEVGDGVPFIIATTTLEKSKQLTQSETKKVETKASGQVVVYNKFDAEPQRLVKNTRFETADGKIYRISDSVIVPGKRGDTPGSVEVTLYADSYGEDYNIPASDFTIPGFKGSPRYAGFFARGVGAMSGGASGNKKLVGASDLASAKDELALSLTSDLKNELKMVKRDGYVPLYTMTQATFTDNEKDVLSGQTSTYHVVATGHLVLANEEALAREIAKGLSQYKNEPLYIDDKSTIAFSIRDGVDVSKDTSFEVLVEGTPRIVWKVDQNQMRQLLLGKDKASFAEVLKGFPSVQKGEMDLSPRWINHFPDSLSKITIIEKLPALSK